MELFDPLNATVINGQSFENSKLIDLLIEALHVGALNAAIQRS
ncbi:MULTISPECIES: hypothetical protein [Prochlorococcus]|uniref:Uncharacterized protein n=1 Tax=Prochlorococcus marinus (strain SARG / CCMP1375 / SS120) TaxID=167539 RepID=Q7VAE6_PROMA|nr:MULTISPECIES: hypothetical protein [Prochlorococcus]AAQ00562.1 Predicted protein family PM-27 [Prochlorococcus marinus subsp. marinus str. CCMP1375]KGG10954.1 putative protein family PM-27 [Prochlorococcus marinus str. LG]KGG19955.1 putative protein family PM-27 [Prochlorococcus marinus str. SS2]KGG24203.1 putative protein family PM-27 [Prochlorococcus marinus str. SS35]KGG31540.1 putative protein family PM-27 [Prochlorococcus marinus str. SS51]